MTDRMIEHPRQTDGGKYRVRVGTATEQRDFDSEGEANEWLLARLLGEADDE